MTASLHALGTRASAGTYYTHDPYREGEEPRRVLRPGRRRSLVDAKTGCRAPRCADQLESFRDLCAGLDPTTGRRWCAEPGPGTGRLGLTLTAPKTLSLLWAASRPEQRTQLEAIHAAAVEEALGFLCAEELAEVRLGGRRTIGARHQPS